MYTNCACISGTQTCKLFSCSLRCEATMYIKYGYVRYYVHQISVTKDLSSLRKEEKKLVLHQQIGSFYTEDYRKYCGGTTNCPRCGLPDSRRHRLEECQGSEHLRAQFPGLMNALVSSLSLDRIPWPFFPCWFIRMVGVCFPVGPTFVWRLMHPSSLGPQATLPFLLKVCFQVHAIRRIERKSWLRARRSIPFCDPSLHLTAKVLLILVTVFCMTCVWDPTCASLWKYRSVGFLCGRGSGYYSARCHFEVGSWPRWLAQMRWWGKSWCVV